MQISRCITARQALTLPSPEPPIPQLQQRPTDTASFLGGSVPLDLWFRGSFDANSFVRGPNIDSPGAPGRVFVLKRASCGRGRRCSPYYKSHCTNRCLRDQETCTKASPLGAPHHSRSEIRPAGRSFGLGDLGRLATDDLGCLQNGLDLCPDPSEIYRHRQRPSSRRFSSRPGWAGLRGAYPSCI